MTCDPSFCVECLFPFSGRADGERVYDLDMKEIERSSIYIFFTAYFGGNLSKADGASATKFAAIWLEPLAAEKRTSEERQLGPRFQRPWNQQLSSRVFQTHLCE